MAKIDENYVEKLVNVVTKKIVEAFEYLTIEDVNMYQIGYNKAIDKFSERLKEKWIESDDLSISSEFFDFVDEIAEETRGAE